MLGFSVKPVWREALHINVRSINSPLSLLTLFIIIKSIRLQLSTAEENTRKALLFTSSFNL